MVWNWADTSTLGVTGIASIPASVVRWLTSAESLRATVRLIPRSLKTRATGSSTVAPSSEGLVDRKSTRLNSSHLVISYAVFCLKKKNRHRRKDPVTPIADAHV